MSSVVISTEIIQSTKDGVATLDLLAVEEPLQIIIGYGKLDNRSEMDLAVTMRTPGHDLELVAGFLLSEGIIWGMDDILHIDHCEKVKTESERGNVVRVELKDKVHFDSKRFQRNFYSSSSCGICGISSIEAIRKQVPDIKKSGFEIAGEIINELPKKLNEHQSVFNHTGGLHAAALFESNGSTFLCREDIGRHNAVDKVIGASLFSGNYPINDKVLFLSGRAGFELIQKAAMTGIQLVAAVGAPSSLAVELAKECRMTLLGFVRDGKFNIYSGKQRIAS